MTETADFTVKLVLIGDAAVGKSCLLRRYMNQDYREESFATIGVDFEKKLLNIEGRSIKLLIWDTAGHERFRAVTKSYYRGAMGAVIVYDITNRESFERVQQWLTSSRNGAGDNLIVILIGNKSDLATKRQVTTAEARRLADENEILFAECSAKNGDQVEKAFMEIVAEVMRVLLGGEASRAMSRKRSLGKASKVSLSSKTGADSASRCC